LGSLQIKITNYDKALATDPHFVLALNNKGLALADLGNDTGAIIYYDKALAIDPKYENGRSAKYRNPGAFSHPRIAR
jgi:tetratricopeptide (TPR) repeat protein